VKRIPLLSGWTLAPATTGGDGVYPYPGDGAPAQRAVRSKRTRRVNNARLIVYAGAPHGITETHKDRLNEDLLAFLAEQPCGATQPGNFTAEALRTRRTRGVAEAIGFAHAAEHAASLR